MMWINTCSLSRESMCWAFLISYLITTSHKRSASDRFPSLTFKNENDFSTIEVRFNVTSAPRCLRHGIILPVSSTTLLAPLALVPWITTVLLVLASSPLVLEVLLEMMPVPRQRRRSHDIDTGWPQMQRSLLKGVCLCVCVWNGELGHLPIWLMLNEMIKPSTDHVELRPAGGLGVHNLIK